MTVLTGGAINVQPAVLATDLDADQLVGRLADSGYTGPAPDAGWAKLEWSSQRGGEEADDQPALQLRRRNVGAPVREIIQGQDVVTARLLFDERYSNLAEVPGQQLPVDVEFQLRALDVVASPVEGGFMLFLASHDARLNKRALNRLRATLGDHFGGVEEEAHPLVPGEDFFLWLLHRWSTNSKRLTRSVKLNEYRTLSNESGTGGVTRSLRGVDLTRADVAAAVAEGHAMGPAKFAFRDQTLGLTADIFFLLNGGFSIHRNATFYAGGILKRGELGLRATVDVGLVALPAILSAYRADRRWLTSVRAEFQEQCETDLAARWTGTCPHCGESLDEPGA